MRLGSEVLLASRRLHGRRVGVVANPASIDHGFGHIVERVAGADGVTLGAIFGPQHGFRFEPAGQHDRDAARLGRPAAGPGLLALQRDARADRRDARGPRRARHRPPGHRRAHLHVHLHDGELPARRGTPWRAGDRLRPAEPDRRRRGRGPDARTRLRVVRRPVSDPDAPRHDRRRARAALQRALSSRRDAGGRADGRLASRAVLGRDRARRG